MVIRSEKAGVIVFGGHVQGYGIINIYGKNSIPCILIDTTEINIARHSRYCLDFYKSSYQEIITLLEKFRKESKYQNWLLIPTDDYYVRILSQNKQLLNGYFKVTLDDWEIIELFFNKRYSYPIAEKAGVPIPRTDYPNSLEDVMKISSTIAYPCIIKPAIMLDFYRHFKHKVFLCNDCYELEKNYILATKVISPLEILVQEIIPGTNENQYSVGMFFGGNRPYNFLVGRRKRQHPIDFGNATTFAETVDVPILAAYAKKILSNCNFTGMCEVEFKFDERDRKYKFLEVNPRTWKWHLISEGAQIPFLMSMYNYFIYGMAIENTEYISCGWRDHLVDFPIIVKMIKKGLFVKSKNKKIINAVYDPDDIYPFLYQLFYMPLLVLKR